MILVPAVWDRISKFFVAMWVDNWNTLVAQIPNIHTAWKDAWQKEVHSWSDEAIRDNIDKFADDMGIDRERLEPLKRAAELPFPADTLVAGLAQMAILIWMPLNWIFQWRNKVQWETNEELRPSLPDAGLLIQYGFKHPEHVEQVKQYLAYAGYNDDIQGMMVSAYQDIPDLNMLYQLLNRGQINETEFLNRLNMSGYDDKDAHDIMGLRHLIPSVGDLTMLAGRDQFEPATIEKFELQKDVPTELVEWGEKIGMSEEWVKKYWGAHWIVPSIGQAFQMIWRGVMDEDELDIFYDLADISPYFRDKLRAITYLPYTRVDVRRMHQIGILNDEQLKQAYMDLGYDSEHAEGMMEFTIRYNKKVDRDLTRTQIEKLYRYGFTDPLEFRGMLQTLDYSEDEAWYIQDLLDYETTERKHQAFIRRIEWQFKHWLIDDIEVGSQLAVLKIRTEKIDEYLAEWLNERVVEETLPTKTDVIGWYRQKLIPEDQFTVYMKKLGFNPDDIGFYIQRFKPYG